MPVHTFYSNHASKSSYKLCVKLKALRKFCDLLRKRGGPFVGYSNKYIIESENWQDSIQARFTQFSRGEFIVDLSLRNPQSENSCDIAFISVKLPKLRYSQCITTFRTPDNY